MMKKPLFFALSLLSLALSAVAADSSETPRRYIPSLIRISDDSAIADLEAEGAKVWHRRGDIIIAFIPDSPEEKPGSAGVRIAPPSGVRAGSRAWSGWNGPVACICRLIPHAPTSPPRMC